MVKYHNMLLLSLWLSICLSIWMWDCLYVFFKYVVPLVETSFLATYGLYFIIHFLHSYTVDNGAIVVYFDQLSGACSTWMLVKLLFSAVFNLFCSFQTFFSDFTAEINKNIWKWTKKGDFVYSSKLVDYQRGYLKIVLFRLIFYFFNVFFSFRLISVSYVIASDTILHGLWHDQ